MERPHAARRNPPDGRGADAARAWPGHGTNQGLRNHALLAVLLGSGLRVSEALGLDRAQYTSKGFVRVEVKGGMVRDFLQLPHANHARCWMPGWRRARIRHRPSLSRAPVVACPAVKPRQASAALPPRPIGRCCSEEHIEVSPHVLRHTFLRKLAEAKGVHYAHEASGHQSDRYIWRYIKPDQQTLAEAVDDLD